MCVPEESLITTIKGMSYSTFFFPYNVGHPFCISHSLPALKSKVRGKV